MISVQNITIRFGGPPLFEDVNVKFMPGNCYGLIGANGAGKSTFLKVLSGDIEASAGSVVIPKRQRVSKLEQDQFKYDEHTVMDTVFMGHPELYKVHIERDALYSKADFSEEDGNRSAVLEGEYAELGGYEAEASAAALLDGLGIETGLHGRQLGELEAGLKVRVLLAQTMFGDPDILLLDEPTNNLDMKTVRWLEDYLERLDSLVIVVSHDRDFLNNVCTHVVDIDFRQLRVYVGNYDFWMQASELALQQRRDDRKKRTDKAKDLKAFIQRFSSNASKARQATSRKKLLEKLTLDDLPMSTRRYPHIAFNYERACGKSVLRIEGLGHTIDGEKVLNNVSFTVARGDKIAFIGQNDRAHNALFRILAGELEPDEGVVEFGTTITAAYLPRENEEFFEDVELHLIDWLRQFSADQHEQYLRGFLGRMLFSGDDAKKPAKVLSGGERVRCMLSRLMLADANFLILEDPTNHLDLESITSLNNGMRDFDQVMLFSSHDREMIRTAATRMIELTPEGCIDHRFGLDEFMARQDAEV